VASPILDCVTGTSRAMENASGFMLAYIPAFSAALVAAGQPATGAAYNIFLFSTCQVVSRVVADALIPLLGIYLAVSVASVLVPELKLDSAAKSVQSAVSWALGLAVTAFVGLLSAQTLVSGSADGATTRATKFLIGSFVPVVGRALSEAVTTAEGCLRLIKTSLGVYGVLGAAFVFLPVLLRAVCWYAVTGVSAMAGEVLGVRPVASVMKSCQSALGILIAITLAFALLIIVSTAVVLVVAGK
jgi:stage III sporulation protein AE